MKHSTLRFSFVLTLIAVLAISFFSLHTPILAQDAPVDVFGSITPPSGVQAYDTQAGGIGILVFFSNVIRAFTLIAGIYVMFNIVLAGFGYVTAGSSGDTGAHQKAKDKITLSVIGLVIIVASYTIMGIIGFVFFGEADYFINPELITPTGAPADTTNPGDIP